MKLSLLALTLGSSLLMLSNVSHADGHLEGHTTTKASSEKQAKTAVTFRKSVLQLVRANMGPLGAMAKGNIPMDAEVIAKNANRIEFLGNMMHDYFALDTSAYKLDTDAKSNIWSNHEDFSAKTNDMVVAAANLQALVANNEEGDYRRGIGALGGTCKACHDEYKQD
ncbi:MAG: cytochrome c [Glaciecola sp.]